MRIIICCLIGYLLGNFSPAYLFGRSKGYDVRKDGSGNAGASNTFILVAPTISVVFPACHYWDTGHLGAALVLLIPAAAIFYKHWENFVRIKEGTEMRVSFIWNKEGELKRIGKWNETTQKQLDRRG